MQLTPCPLPQPLKLMEMPRTCGGERYIDRGAGWDEEKQDGPNAVTICRKCGARWTWGSKDEQTWLENAPQDRPQKLPDVGA